MGTLRFTLAIAVVVVHASYLYGHDLYGLKLTGGVVSVQTFFIISGFYMALILDTKYVGQGSYRLFLTNRFLRIYPAYWVVLLLTLVVATAFPSATHIFGFSIHDYVRTDPALSLETFAFLILTNLVLFGQDTVLFQAIDDQGGLLFTPDFENTEPALYTFMPLPQAWTLSLELMFYVLAPYFAKKTTATLVGLILASLALRLVLYFGADLYHDPWTYRFFPTELAFFLAGMVSYRAYAVVKEQFVGNGTTILSTAFLIGVTVGYQFFPGDWEKQWLYYALVLALIPAIFREATSQGSIDGWMGELSYPIYISHIFVLLSLSPLLASIGPSIHINLIVCLGTVAFSWLLVRFVVRPLEDYRQRRVIVPLTSLSVVPSRKEAIS